MKINKILIILLFFAIFIRLLGINNVLFFDETSIIRFLVSNAYSWDPPLYLWILHLFTYLFGFKVWMMRFVSIFFSILGIILMYFIANKVYNKKVAHLSIFLVSISFFSILSALQISDESLQLFLYLSCFLSYLKFEKKTQKKWLIITGLFLGLAFLTKYAALLFLIVLSLYILFKNGFKKSVKIFPWIYIPTLIVFSTFPIYYLLTNPALFYKTIDLLINNVTNPYSLNIFVRGFMLLLWITPLLIGFFILSLFNINKRNLIFIMWISIVSIFNFTFLKYGDIPRYFMIIIPPLIFLIADLVSRIKFKKRDICFVISSTFIFYIIFFFINKFSIIKYPHIITYYISSIKQFDFNFMIPYAISEGSWFGVSFYNILIMTILFISFMSIIILLMIKYRFDLSKIKLILLLFLSFGLSYNLFLDGEYLLHLSQPNVDKVIKDMIVYTNENDIPKPIYVSDRGFLDYIYSYEEYPNRVEIWKYKIDERRDFEINKGSIFFVNFAAKVKLEDIEKKCKLKKTFSDKGIKIGYIFFC